MFHMKGKGGAQECNVTCLVIVTRALLGSWGKYSVCRLGVILLCVFLPIVLFFKSHNNPSINFSSFFHKAWMFIQANITLNH